MEGISGINIIGVDELLPSVIREALSCNKWR